MVTDYDMLTRSRKFTKPILSPNTKSNMNENFFGTLQPEFIMVYWRKLLYQTRPHIKVDSIKLFTNNDRILKYFYLLK